MRNPMKFIGYKWDISGTMKFAFFHVDEDTLNLTQLSHHSSVIFPCFKVKLVIMMIESHWSTFQLGFKWFSSHCWRLSKLILILLLPSGKLTQLSKFAIEIVDLPIKNCDFPQLCKRLPEGITFYYNSSIPTAPWRLVAPRRKDLLAIACGVSHHKR